MFSMLSTVSGWITSDGSAAAEQAQSQQIPTLGNVIPESQKYLVTPKQLETGPPTEIITENTQPSTSIFSAGMKRVVGLIGVWFMTIAAGSLLCSIPLAIASLPFVCVVIVSIMIVGQFVKWLFGIWLGMVRYCLLLIRDVIMYPRHLVATLSSWIGSYFTLGFKKEVKPVLRIREEQREPRMYKLERHRSRKHDWQRQDEYGRRVYESRLISANPNGKPPVDMSRALQNRSSFDFGRRPSSDLSTLRGSFQKDQTAVRNPQFLFLTPDDEYRLSLCSELYASSTNMKPEDFLIRLGRDEEDQVHYVLSIWDEPSHQSQLNLDSVIGFCEYFLCTDAPHTVQIDKLNINSTYSENGFSRLMIRKLMHMPNILSIRVWSVWHAESFYKSLGFRNVFKTENKDQLPSKIEGEHGPLLVWVSNAKRELSDRSSRNSTLHSMPSTESLPNMKSRDASSLKSKDSMSSILGGVGAYECK